METQAQTPGQNLLNELGTEAKTPADEAVLRQWQAEHDAARAEALATHEAPVATYVAQDGVMIPLEEHQKEVEENGGPLDEGPSSGGRR